jgi:hypothetical protein
MRREPVNSSNVSEVGYDEASSTLEVVFKNSGVYQYFDIPKSEYELLIAAPSIGQYLNQNIKGKYRYARV